MIKPKEFDFPAQAKLVAEIPTSMEDWIQYLLPEAQQSIHLWDMGCIWEQWYDRNGYFLQVVHLQMDEDSR